MEIHLLDINLDNRIACSDMVQMFYISIIGETGFVEDVGTLKSSVVNY